MGEIILGIMALVFTFWILVTESPAPKVTRKNYREESKMTITFNGFIWTKGSAGCDHRYYREEKREFGSPKRFFLCAKHRKPSDEFNTSCENYRLYHHCPIED